MLQQNVGGADRLIRIVLGIALLAAVVIVDAPWRWAGLIGIIPLGTALMGSCPLYSLFGFSTCPLPRAR
ncbi:MAG: DUF2892 domain-containing protein [Gemmatimonadaceae bacterium]|jgi:hypothetical protein|nr:DUF2892 domain-containing protein [Gemmatimonadaceae bacterium]